MDQHHPPNDLDRVDANDPIARLLKLAGSRPQPDPERTVSFERDLRAEWLRVTTPRAQRRTFGWAAAIVVGTAAAIALAWLPLWRTVQPPAAPLVVGRVVRSEGIVRSMPGSAASAPWRSVTVGDEIRADTLIETTGSGRTALTLGAGTSLRVDVDSRVVMIGDTVVRLERGALYVDSGTEKSGPILVRTQAGDVRDIGTQFEVRDDSASVRVRVRGGEVLVHRAGLEVSARAGEALQFDRRGRHLRSTAPIFGPEWEWIGSVTPPFELEGSTVQQFLDWVAREQGWRWRFVDTDTASRAARIVTHGSLDGYTPEEALAIVLPTCGLSFVRNRDQVVVSFIKESSPRGQ